MNNEDFITIATDQVICENVRILSATSESIFVEDQEGRKLELSMDSITSVG